MVRKRSRKKSKKIAGDFNLVVPCSQLNSLSVLISIGGVLNRWFLPALIIVVLQGCATSVQKTASMRQFIEKSQYDLALLEAEKQLADDKGVMQYMNVGVLRRLNGDYKGSNRALEQAKQKIDELYATSVSEQAGALLVNDEMISFEGDKFEQVLIHLYMASNFLNLQDIDAARVELLQSQVKMDTWDKPEDEVPFMHYFAGIMFEILGEPDAALVSYRKAVNAYINTRDQHGLNVPLVLQSDLLRLLEQLQLTNELTEYRKQFGSDYIQLPDRAGKGELVVVLGNGLVAQRDQIVIHTWSPELSANIKIAVPAYRDPPVKLNSVRLQVNGKYYPLEVVSNIDGLARAALSAKMPIIIARAIARAVAKKKTEKEVGKQNDYAQLIMLIVNFSTEIADTRSWNTLPQEFELARVLLPEGEYNVAIELVNSGGHIVDTITEKVNIEVGRMSVLSKRWTAPTLKNKLGRPVEAGSSVKKPVSTVSQS